MQTPLEVRRRAPWFLPVEGATKTELRQAELLSNGVPVPVLGPHRVPEHIPGKSQTHGTIRTQTKSTVRIRVNITIAMIMPLYTFTVEEFAIVLKICLQYDSSHAPFPAFSTLSLHHRPVPFTALSTPFSIVPPLQSEPLFPALFLLYILSHTLIVFF